jgi:hypothetical protein
VKRATPRRRGARPPGINGDYVQVSPPCAAEFKGNVPVLQTEVWQGLKPAKQEKLIESGLISIEPQWAGLRAGG